LIGLTVVGGYFIKRAFDAGAKHIEAREKSNCKSRWQQSGLDVQWKAGVGCLVDVNGHWVPEANVQLQPADSTDQRNTF